jgi:hypothetical protein
MTMSARVQIPSLVSTMLICQWKKLNVVKKSACSCFHPTWNPTSHAIMTKASWIPSWIRMCLLPWVQCKKWIPIGSMGCVHTNQKIPTNEKCGSLNHIWNIVEKTRENNWKAKKIGRIISQSPIPRLEHDNIQAWWASYILSRSMLEMVWWRRW